MKKKLIAGMSSRSVMHLCMPRKAPPCLPGKADSVPVHLPGQPVCCEKLVMSLPPSRCLIALHLPGT